MHSPNSFKKLAAALLVSAAPFVPAAAIAQEIPGITPAPAPTPTPQATPNRITPPITYSLPAGSGSTPTQSPAPAPAQATPTPTPVPTLIVPTPIVVAPRATPTPAPARTRQTPAPQASAPVEATPEVVPETTPVPPEPLPETTPQAPPAAGAPPPAAAQPDDGSSGWPWLIGLGIAVLAIGGVAFARKQSRGRDLEDSVEPAAPREMTPAEAPPPPVAAPPPPPPVPAQPRPAAPAAPAFLSTAPRAPASPIEIALVPHRAGMTILEGVIDFSLVVTNRGSERAEQILLSAFLRTANARQDEEIAELLSATPDPRGHNPFTLASGESRQFDAGLTIPKAMIHAVQAGNARVFVPLLVVGARYRSGLTTGKRASAAFLVGRRRSDSDRLGPLPFDGEPKMFDTLAARQHVPAAPGALRMAG